MSDLRLDVAPYPANSSIEVRGRWNARPVTHLVGTYGPRSTASLLGLLAGPAARLCDVIEARLDYLPDAAERLAEIVRASPRPVMATCRRAGDGGAFVGDETARLDLLARAADAGAAWIDVEDRIAAADVGRLVGRGAKIVRSLHVPTLPDHADDVVARLLEPPADAAKLVALRATPAEVVRILDLVRRYGDRLGAHVADSPFSSRYAGAALGSLFTYASLRPGGLIPAPIPAVWTTVERMGFERLRSGAPLFVLLGADVERSVSPDMLNAAFESLGLPHVALRWSCDDPAPALDAIERFGWAGAAVTIPHKRRVLELLRERGARLWPEVNETGAVNTVLRDEAGLIGHNTDVRGILDAVRPFASAANVAGRSALVLGAGGAARAAVRAAIRLGCKPIVVHARRVEAAREVVSLRRDGDPEIVVARTAQEAAAFAPALVLQATPAGRDAREAPVFDFALIPRGAIVQEMIVAPTKTANHAAAVAAGLLVVDGFEMLLRQAREQVRLISNRSVDVDVLRDAGRARLDRGAASIVLVGLRCTGKTEIGSRLARLLGRPFVDIDVEVEASTGRSPDAMIRDGDERAFRAAEAEAMRSAFDRPSVVVATGGGAALHAALLRGVPASWPIVYLDATDDVLLARWAATPRAALSDLPPERELARQRAERGAIYQSIARVTLDASRESVDEIAESLADHVDRDWVVADRSSRARRK